MKTAILVYGNIRTAKQCIPSLLETFEFLDPQYYVSTYNQQWVYHPAIQNRHRFYAENMLDEELITDIVKPLDPIRTIVSSTTDWNLFYKRELDNLDPNMKNIESCYIQYVNLRLSLLNLEYFLNNYDIVIKTRFDLIYNRFDLDNIDLTNTLVVDNKNVYPNDCILISTKKNIFKLSEFVFNEFYKVTNPKSTQQAPHGLIEAASENLDIQIKTKDIMKYVLRATGPEYY
jgi:hydroxymethylpyrimidine pyrophosphatase-like HAD family hydrolase